MRKIVFLLTLLVFFSFDKPKLVRKTIAEGISVSLPKTWHPMDDLDFNERYPSVRAPIAAYTDEDRLMDFSVNISATQWPDANAEIAQKFFKAALFNAFDHVDMIQEGIVESKGHWYVFFEFESTVRGRRDDLSNRETILKYSYIKYLVEPRRTLVFSFHCPRRNREEWQETAGKIMSSIKIKG